MTLNVAALPSCGGAGGVLYVSFNQDHGCLSVGTETGFRVFNCDPFRETLSRDVGGGVGIVEMLFRSNILALVGGGSSPAPGMAPNRLRVWDDHQQRALTEFALKDPVRAVRLRRDTVVVATDGPAERPAVHVYGFESFELQHKYYVHESAHGVFALSAGGPRSVLACTMPSVGRVRVEDLTRDDGTTFNAHDSALAMIALSPDGSLLATASGKGTLIRVFATGTGERVKEIRRGVSHATVYSLCFSPDSRFIAASSSSGTVHVWSLDDADAAADPAGEETATNQRSVLSALRYVAPQSVGQWVGSEWSFARYAGPAGPSACAFAADPPGTLFVAGADGSFLHLLVDTSRGGDAALRHSFHFRPD